MKKTLALTLTAIMSLGTAAFAETATHAPHWAYPADGAAEDWGTLSGDFATCAAGSQQSPIDIAMTTHAEVSPPVLHWSDKAALSVVNNGHTIQVNVTEGGNITLDGKDYALVQFHFHTPSEHAVDGTRAPMEVHFVHKAEDGSLAVIGALMNGGGANDLFSGVMAKAGEATADGVALDATYDLTGLLPADHDIYRYEGSLTTPPCSEIVEWSVMENPVAVADSDIAAFQAIFPMNARALQPVNRRFVLKQ